MGQLHTARWVKTLTPAALLGATSDQRPFFGQPGQVHTAILAVSKGIKGKDEYATDAKGEEANPLLWPGTSPAGALSDEPGLREVTWHVRGG